jgi:zinc transporter
MFDMDVREMALRPGLVWGFDFADGAAAKVTDADLLHAGQAANSFRWLHFNLADQRTLRWLSETQPVSAAATAVLLAPDHAQHGVAEEETIGLILHDLELDFAGGEPRVGVLRVAVGPTMIVTARHHPIQCAETVKSHIDAGAIVCGPAEALSLIFDAMAEGFRAINTDLEAQVQAIEDELLKDHPSPDSRAFTTMRSLMVRMHRLFAGARAALRSLDEYDAPRPYREVFNRFITRLSALDSELLAHQSELRILRDELDLQATQQTNANLYFLSVLSALLLPATLVTGIFGINTGGLLWTNDKYGSIWATGLALASAGAVYVVLRMAGFIRK